MLLVYVIYLLFQLSSHAYMYQSTPQRIIDEESTPGPVANWLDTSSSDDDSSDGSDSDGSGRSRDTVTKRVKRVIRGRRRRRKSSIASMDTVEMLQARTPSFATTNVSASHDDHASEEASSRPFHLPRLRSNESNEEAVEDEKPSRHPRKHRRRLSIRKQRKHAARKTPSQENVAGHAIIRKQPDDPEKASPLADGEPRRVDFAITDAVPARDGLMDETAAPRRLFNPLRGMSLRPVAQSLAPTVFMQAPDRTAAMPAVPTGPVPRVRYGIRRTNSLPDRLNHQLRPTGAMMPSQLPPAAAALPGGTGAEGPEEDPDALSRLSAIVLLLVSTGLVAVCAEFMVDSIDAVVNNSGVSEVFIGLIILPIVGNAAEHVTAVTVAMKNKMDLGIGVAVGSSIQIALFITPLIVILGWIIDRDMTLYFTLFETVCLFVSTFIVNFLVLDGRSNYLEGALLCATYVIISVVAFYYPNSSDASIWGK